MRFEPYLGLVSVLLLGVFVVAFSGGVTVDRSPAPRVSFDPSLFQALTLSPFGLFRFNHITPAASSTQSDSFQNEPSVLGSVSPFVAAPPPTVILTASRSAREKLAASASLLRASLVNIVCRVPRGGVIYSISGSGVIIDPRGMILTNAHVAQNFLLTSRQASCTVRAGTPAVTRYNAMLVYISPLWVEANADILTKTNPRGTGEHDFALLAITSSATSTPLPLFFPSVPLAERAPEIGTPVAIATYGAQFLDPSEIRSALFPTVVFGSVKDVFTFATTSVDIIALGGSAAAQEGSSGGGVVDASGKLVGTITTSTIIGEVSDRKLNALTASYIRAEYKKETGKSFGTLFAKPLSVSIAEFALEIPALEAILTAHLP